MENKFANIYNKGIWGKVNGVGVSGSGSNISPDNKWYMKELYNIINDNNVSTICDIGCGDWNISKEINWDGLTYLGIDVYRNVIQTNQKLYSKDNISFVHDDILKRDIKGYDLIIIKDVLQHWEDIDITNMIEKLLHNNKLVYIVNGFKFGRTPEKNNWTIRNIQNKYSYHPLDLYKKPLDDYCEYVKDIKTRRYKQYVLLKCQGCQG